MKYLVGTSFFAHGRFGAEYRTAFHRHWRASVARMTPAPSRVVVVCEGGSVVEPAQGYEILRLTGDLGHCGQILNGTRASEFSSWSSAMLLCAMAAYSDESDFVYVEEDCLLFGDCLGAAYRALGHGQMIFGQKHRGPPHMSCSQSFFVVRHAFIPKFVATFITLGGEKTVLGEDKFIAIENQFGTAKIRRLPFGVDRERPLPIGAPVWYAQQITPDELTALREAGLL